MTVDTLPDDDGVRVLRAEGEVDVTVADGLLAAVPSLLADATAVVLDLSRVTFFDSSGVRLVDRLTRESAQQSVTMRVVAPQGSPARRVLDLVGLSTGLVCETLAEARQAVPPTR